jgi:hypothetical protein
MRFDTQTDSETDRQMLPATGLDGSWRRPLGKRQPQQAHQPQQPREQPQSQQHEESSRFGSKRPFSTFPHCRKARAKAALLLLLLPLLALAALLYRRSSGDGSPAPDDAGRSLVAATTSATTTNVASSAAAAAAAASRGPVQRRPRRKLRLSSFGKNETARGETAQLWLTLASDDDEEVDEATADGVGLQVRATQYVGMA